MGRVLQIMQCRHVLVSITAMVPAYLIVFLVSRDFLLFLTLRILIDLINKNYRLNCTIYFCSFMILHFSH